MDILDKINEIIDKHATTNKQETKTINSETIKQNIGNKTGKNKYNIPLNIYHTRGGTYIDITGFPQEIIKKIKNYYTISNKNILGYIEHTSVWTHKGNKLYIPRFGSCLLNNKFSNINFTNGITCNNPLPNMTYLGKLNEGNQEIVFDNIINKFRANYDSGMAGAILNLQAGMGKTFISLKLISELKCRTLVVVHNENMLNQWYKLLVDNFPNNTTGKYYGKNKTLGDNMVGIINSLVKEELSIKSMGGNITPRTFFDMFDLVIFDEVHLYSSKENRKIYNVAQSPYMIGLSATPDEHEKNWDKINEWGVGPVLTASNLEGFVLNEVKFKGHVTKVCYSGPPEYTEQITNAKLDLVSVPLMIEQLADDPYRFYMLMDLIMDQYNKGMNTLVFADRRSYLERILNELEFRKLEASILENDQDKKNLNGIKAFNIMGGSKESEFALAKETGNIILSTYQYMSTGISIQKLNSVILCTPRKSKSKQIINRIFRLGSDESIVREIIDIVDMKVSLKKQWYQRKLYYDEQDFTIEVKKICWKDIEKKISN